MNLALAIDVPGTKRVCLRRVARSMRARGTVRRLKTSLRAKFARPTLPLGWTSFAGPFSSVSSAAP